MAITNPEGVVGEYVLELSCMKCYSKEFNVGITVDGYDFLFRCANCKQTLEANETLEAFRNGQLKFARSQ